MHVPDPAQCFARGLATALSRHNVPGRARTSGPGPEGEKSRLVIRHRKVRLPHWVLPTKIQWGQWGGPTMAHPLTSVAPTLPNHCHPV